MDPHSLVSQDGQMSKSPAGDPRGSSSRPMKMRRNMFGLSEASLAKPESTQVAAEGRVQTRSDHDSSNRNSVSNNEFIPVLGTTIANADTEPAKEQGPAQANDAAESAVRSSPAVSQRHDTPSPQVSPDSSQVEQVPYPSERISGTKSPEIRVRSPSKPSSPAVSPLLMPQEPGSTSPISLPSVPQCSPASLKSEPSDILPVDQDQGPFVKARQLPPRVNLPAALETPSPVLNVHGDLPLSLNSNLTRKGQIVRSVRRIVVRRQILALLLGKQLGGATFTQLKQMQDLT